MLLQRLEKLSVRRRTRLWTGHYDVVGVRDRVLVESKAFPRDPLEPVSCYRKPCPFF